ncbi:phage tail sheath family protein [Aquipseudomonas alcaligenes]|uniref:Tail protein n=1 Tax=Aquipseudomonas alcaligenes TaxID=43263 RepID=A0AA37CJE4_AQUAC|nr:phage tail sheath C-terminal domain-containing protein [Pseudomonas alcaligenes]BCR24628.1 tail protein [Pseudomonas alcaligenes]GIZ68033.1 tail protein [Pseudomonas alcaligenes]GIZ72525.1 tail protein [Pseudomonas alcaligenes]GIZ76876.1 tail protein [Pseudomonas alcaligenes]GIZ81031.1 tail protein [Pseudomonas alcaligenes]
MPSNLSYPGVYIEEVPSGVRTITGVATSITAFVGRGLRGPVNDPVRVQSFAEYSRLFGGLWQPSTLSYAVLQFFQHGGSDALIVRVFGADDADASKATLDLATATGSLLLEAASPGTWGNRLQATVDHDTRDTSDQLLFNLLIEELDRPGGSVAVASELFRNVSVDPLSPRFVDTVLNEQSALVNVRTSAPIDESPTNDTVTVANPDGTATTEGTLGDDGADIVDAQIIGNENLRTGIYALDEADLFNLLCIPPLTRDTDLAAGTLEDAAIYCQQRRALLIIDSPVAWTATPSTTISAAETGVNGLRSALGNAFAINAAVYFPRLRMPDPLSENRLADFAPCGAVAGIMARTDVQRGVWKAPAGLAASLSGVQGLTYTMTDRQNGVLNPVGLNCLRTFPVAGHLVWGARTLAGADLLASEWKYVPVRRLALFLEESLFRGTQWVVFEPNDEPLWAQIRLNIGAFMQDLFRQGAFQGSSPRDAYFVKCDRETTTQSDINRGVVNILVGFAPLKPAEFVVIKLQQMAGQIDV